MYCIFYSQFGCLKVTAVLLLVIAASQGSKLDGRANAVEAESNLKTHTWKDVEDYNPEIFQKENYDKSDDDFLIVVQKQRRSCSNAESCQMLNQACYNTEKLKKAVCISGGCACKTNNARYPFRCDQCLYTGK